MFLVDLNSDEFYGHIRHRRECLCLIYYTVRRHILLFFLLFCRLDYEERERREERKEKDV